MSNTDNNIYFKTRDDLNISREKVEELSSNQYHSILTKNILDKIETGKQNAQPCHVYEMSEIYNKPELCYYYCSNECAIGTNIYPLQIDTVHDLPQITIQLLSKLNSLQRDKDRIIDIIADGKVTEDEKKDFEIFQSHLEEMSLTINALKMWVKKESKLQELLPSNK